MRRLTFACMLSFRRRRRRRNAKVLESGLLTKLLELGADMPELEAITVELPIDQVETWRSS